MNTDATSSTFNVYGDGGDDIFLRMIPDSHEFQLRYNGSSGNLFKINTAANGATTLSTADQDGTAGHMTLDVDGNITLDADGGTITFSDAGSSLGTITSSGYSGNAGTATTLATARNIGGVSFDGSANINLPGVNTSGSQDTSGNAATATALATARNIGGVSFDGTSNINLPGVNTSGDQDTTGTATNATNAAHVSLADNESTNENNAIIFGEGATYTGNVGLETDGDFHYNPSTGTVTATIFKGNIDAVDGDFDGTMEADAISIGGTTITSTAAELNILDGVTATATELNIMDGVTATTAEINVLDGGLSASDIPNLATSKVTSGTFADARIASSNVTQHSGDITSLGTLSALTVDNINVNGNTIKSTNSDGDLIFGGNDGGSSITALTLDMSASGKAIFNDTISVGDEVRMPSDGSAIRFGADEEMVLEHQHNTGLRLSRNDDSGTPTLQFHDAGESIGSDGSKLILTSGGTTFNMPTSDGSSGQFLKTNGSGTLSFASASGGGASALNDLSDVTYSSGDLTISSLDKIISGSLEFDSSGDLTFDADGGDVFLKDAGTQFGRIKSNGLGEFEVNGGNQSSIAAMKTNDAGKFTIGHNFVFVITAGITNVGSNKRLISFNTTNGNTAANDPGDTYYNQVFLAPFDCELVGLYGSFDQAISDGSNMIELVLTLADAGSQNFSSTDLLFLQEVPQDVGAGQTGPSFGALATAGTMHNFLGDDTAYAARGFPSPSVQSSIGGFALGQAIPISTGQKLSGSFKADAGSSCRGNWTFVFRTTGGLVDTVV